jgi:hypothetical protein
MHSLFAQEPATRKDRLDQLRKEEGGKYGDDEVTRVERGLLWMNDHKVQERLTRGIGGVRIVLGNLITGSGFGLGPEYYRDDLRDGAVQFNVAVRASTRKYILAEAKLEFPRLLARKAYAGIGTRWRNYPGVNYYGPGPDSRKSGRTGYRLEDALHEFGFGYQPVRGAKLGVTGGYLQVNVGPGSDSRYVSTDQVYSPLAVPGLLNQTSFLEGGLLAEYDNRDSPGGAHIGGLYQARFEYYHDLDLKRHTHRRLRLEAQQYIPFFNRRRVIALRGYTNLTFENPGQVVPFYLQPTVGGSDDLRGFRPFRFYDDNNLVLNAEYRWEIFTGLDGALFFDAAKVFPRKSQLNFHDLEGSAGFGFRVNVRNNVFLRLDVGFSHEGFNVWFKFSDVFLRTAPRLPR